MEGGCDERRGQAADWRSEGDGDGFVWNAPQGGVPFPSLQDEADAMHGLLVLRADKLEGCTEGSSEETELKMIADTVQAYEAKRWPDGIASGGKG